jgi:hypothetical protein
MEIRAVVIPRIIRKPKTLIQKVFYAFLLVIELFWNTVIPFLVGFEFALSYQAFWFILLLIFLFLHLEIDYVSGDVKFKFIRVG